MSMSSHTLEISESIPFLSLPSIHISASYDFPTLSASVTAAGEKMGIVFSLKADSEPIDGPYEFSGAQTPLFGMTAEELDAELQKYNDGLNATLGKLLPLIMSASMG